MKYLPLVGLGAALFVQSTNAGHYRNDSMAIAYTTLTVDVFTTYCPSPTVFTQGTRTYTVTEETTFTITDCPCTYSRPVHTTTSVPAPTLPPYEPPTHHTTNHLPSSSQLTLFTTPCESSTTITVSLYSTYCPEPTTLTYGDTTTYISVPGTIIIPIISVTPIPYTPQSVPSLSTYEPHNEPIIYLPPAYSAPPSPKPSTVSSTTRKHTVVKPDPSQTPVVYAPPPKESNMNSGEYVTPPKHEAPPTYEAPPVSPGEPITPPVYIPTPVSTPNKEVGTVSPTNPAPTLFQSSSGRVLEAGFGAIGTVIIALFIM